MKKIAIDTYYRSEQEAYTVGIIFEEWDDKKPLSIVDDVNETFDRYIPGEFYKRELPCILRILNKINILEFDSIILDGYIDLKDNEGNIKPGLGRRLCSKINIHDDLDIIGIAKSLYCRTDEISYKLVRNSSKALYCQSLRGNSLDFLKYLDGDYRIPTLLKLLDNKTKGIG